MTIKEIVFCDGVNDHVEIAVNLEVTPIPTIGKFGTNLMPTSATCEFVSTCCGYGSAECKMTTHKAMYED